MKKILCTSLLLFLCVAATCQTVLTGMVVGVADGDTFTLLTPAKKEVKVRLHGIDCPERNQDFGTRAKQYTSAQLFRKTVKIQVKSKDRYGRYVALVRLPNGRILNEELLKAGMAWHFTRYDRSSSWAALERAARAKRVGLWSLKDPVAPWTFRKHVGKPRTGVLKIPASNSRRITSRVSSPCGARTNSGDGCRRLVRGGGHCYQHL